MSYVAKMPQLLPLSISSGLEKRQGFQILNKEHIREFDIVCANAILLIYFLETFML